jgi:cytoskeletal protein RodZ
MNEPRDELDRALADGLGALAAPSPDADAALVALRPQMRRARARHRVMQVSLVTGVLVLVAGVAAVAANNGSNKDSVSIVAPPTSGSTPHDSRPKTSTTTLPHTTTTISGVPGRTPRTTPDTDDAGPTITTPATTPSATNPPPAAPEAEQHSYTAPGGTLTVRFADGRLSIVSYDARAGYTAEVHTDTADDVEVRFTRGSGGDSKIRVRVVDGNLQPEID